MGQIWFKNNKAGQKWSEEEAVEILGTTYEWLNDNKQVVLKGEVELYLMETHSLGVDTYRDWINKTYTNNRSIQQIARAIDLILEARVVYDERGQLRSNIQGMVLQNKHNYREKSDIEANLKFAKMPKVMIGDKALDITQENNDGDQSDKEESSS